MERDSDPLKLENQLCFPIYLCSKEVIRRYTPLLEKIDLTYTQYIVMMYFWEKKKSNVKEISDTLLLDPSTLTPLLKKLESKGFVTRIRSTKDERNLEVEITEKGKKLKNKAKFVPEKIEKCINLSGEEAIALYSLMYKVLNNIERNE
ncbi:MarR family transcriptional regulator [Candidatus Saccharibacteria bacterium]|nr:MarR family transcriptional regulator [Candidatus Saccharibacteria bacterium]